MADEASRAAKAPTATPVSEFANVEFLENSLSDPLNVLRAKLKELSELPDDVLVRRVLIITDLRNEDGRGLDVIWSEDDDESTFAAQDALISMLTRVKNIIASGD